MSEKLHPCACGGRPIIKTCADELLDTSEGFVECTKCGRRTNTVHYASANVKPLRRYLMDKWNLILEGWEHGHA